MAVPKVVLPKDSLVVVTGANGLIASHICNQLLLAGYRVRGTVRSVSKSAWMPTLFNSTYGEDKFSLVEVAKMEAADAFDVAVKGARGLVHAATPVMQSFDPNEAVPMIVGGAVNALSAASKEPGLTRVVLTSSSTAAASPQPNVEFSMDETTWNETAVKAAWAPPPYEGLQRRLDVYSASKTQAEQAAWKFMEDGNPRFVLNTVLPNANIGPVLSPAHQGYPSTVGWVKALWNGFEGAEDLKFNPPQYFVNVQDNARVHVAALIYEDVKGERLFAFAYPYTWNTMLAAFRRMYPGKKFIEDMEGLGEDKSQVANGRAEELVRRFGRTGWTGLEETLSEASNGWLLKGTD